LIFKFIILTITVLFFGFGNAAHSQTNSVLSSGDWYKFSVENDGVYRINYDLLNQVGINPDIIDPRNIKIFTGRPGMLPQAISKIRQQDLSEIAIAVSGEADGKFNREDFRNISGSSRL
jgi:hypothetical protein